VCGWLHVCENVAFVLLRERVRASLVLFLGCVRLYVFLREDTREIVKDIQRRKRSCEMQLQQLISERGDLGGLRRWQRNATEANNNGGGGLHVR
jgi:hypothetical protein